MAAASLVLRDRRELLRLEWRNRDLKTISQLDSPYRSPVFLRFGRENSLAGLELACAGARKGTAPLYSRSYFVSIEDGLGTEVMDLCVPAFDAGRLSGYLVATYSLEQILHEMLLQGVTSNREISFTEADGTRLALRAGGARASRIFVTQQVLDLPGNTLLLRMTSWRGAPDLFPNLMTALVLLMSIALVSVVALLGKDMRRRHKAERELAQALAFRKAMEDSLVTGLRARDLDGKTHYVNPAFCEMVGFSAAELLQAGNTAPYWPHALVDEYAQRQAIRLAGRVPPREGFESVFMRKDGTQFPVLIIEAPLIDAYGQQTGWMSAFLDISEQRRVQEQSRASQERLQATARLATVGEMASLLGHELNQPLAAISSYATGSVNLLDQTADRSRDGLPALAGPAATLLVLQSELKTAFERIAEQAERAGRVIKSVNDFVRRREGTREPVAPRSLVEAVLPLVSLQARKLGVRVQVDVTPDLPWVQCDRTMVEQVILNLARNAMQSMDDPAIHHRVLWMTALLAEVGDGQGALQAAGFVRFEIRDVGAGMTEEVMQKLFTPFFTTKSEGMGLGLSLCRTVVEQHGGALGLRANHPQGMVFSFTLPLSTRSENGSHIPDDASFASSPA
jgi:two-component system sensor histidine kinase DctS